MTVTKIDHVSLLELEELYGVVQRLTRRARVINLPPPPTDYSQLMQALAASGIPAVNSLLAGVPNVVLTQRKVRLVEEDPTTCDVDLTYEFSINEGQSMDAPPAGLFYGEYESSLNQVQTNQDVNGNDITTQYTYPGGYDLDPSLAGTTQTQGAQLGVMIPQTNFKLRGIKQTTSPWNITRAIEGFTNAVTWQGGLQDTWLCTGARYRPQNLFATPVGYFMEFDFQYNPDGWNSQSALYIDPNSGKPPSDLVPGTGIVTPQIYNRVNFNTVLGFTPAG